MVDLEKNSGFDMWCYSALDERIKLEDGKPVPLLTTVLHRACANDPKRFAEAMRALQIAFEAGQSFERTGS
jgi:hypothetical protein